MNLRKKVKQKKLGEIWLTEKGNPKLRNFGYVTHEEMMIILASLRDILFTEVIIAKFLKEQNASIIDPKTGMPTTSEGRN